ncbi:MAG: hypothetical protein NTU53_05110 [Planctomycetota bacterium]|nr:hypothetical protein [Planctomycetota bacterium]
MGGMEKGGGVLVGLGAGRGGDAEAMKKHRMLLRRARFLSAADQSLLKLSLEGEYSVRELGVLFGISAGSVCRRVRRLMTRLRDPVVVALIEFPVDLPEAHRQAGILRLLVGQKTRTIAKEMGQGLGEVRAMLAYVRGWAGVSRHLWGKAMSDQARRGGEEVADEG